MLVQVSVIIQFECHGLQEIKLQSQVGFFEFHKKEVCPFSLESDDRQGDLHRIQNAGADHCHRSLLVSHPSELLLFESQHSAVLLSNLDTVINLGDLCFNKFSTLSKVFLSNSSTGSTPGLIIMIFSGL
jgi:hypothetical protein